MDDPHPPSDPRPSVASAASEPTAGADVDSLGSPFGDLAARARIWLRWVGPGRIAASIGAAVVIAALAWWLLRSPPAPTEARLSAATHAVSASSPLAIAAESGGADSTTTVPPTAPPGTVVVHVAGAVVAPGVYELPAGARVADAISAAGGPTADAQPDALNLAAPVLDGDRVAVGRRRDSLPPDGGGVSHAATAGVGPTEPLDLNTATAAELDALPGVGPATASAIVTHRETNGPFASVDELEAVRGIGPAKLEALRGLVTV